MSAPVELPAEFGRYRIVRKVGQGGMGAVYLAEDTNLGRRVALKVPHFSAEDGPAAVERFHREARLAAAIDHPNICPIYDTGEINGIHFLTMPFIDGAPLSQKVDPSRPLALHQAAELVRRLALAVAVMHERGVIHRDLKPGNVLVRPSGDPVVMDFGLARSASGSGRLTTTGVPLGTPAYMSPEQVRGEQSHLSPATDIYSLGVIFFELITGQLPFEGPLPAVCYQIVHAAPPAPSQRCAGLDAQADSICQKAMAKATGDRYASMTEFAAALAAYLEGMKAAPLRTSTGAAGGPLGLGHGDKPSHPKLAPPLQATAEAAPLPGGATKVACPSCGKRCKLSARALGKRVRCPSCGAGFRAPSAATPRSTALPRNLAETGRLEEAQRETRAHPAERVLDAQAAEEQVLDVLPAEAHPNVPPGSRSVGGRADWYYARDGKPCGPVTEAQLKELARAGTLRPQDLVWQEGNQQWEPASSVKGLLPLSKGPPPLPVTPPLPGEGIRLRILYAGQWFLVDVNVDVYLDGQFVGRGSAIKGIDLEVRTAPGSHELEVRLPLRYKRYILNTPAAGRYTVRLQYSTFWGNFASNIDVQYLGTLSPP